MYIFLIYLDRCCLTFVFSPFFSLPCVCVFWWVPELSFPSPFAKTMPSFPNTLPSIPCNVRPSYPSIRIFSSRPPPLFTITTPYNTTTIPTNNTNTAWQGNGCMALVVAVLLHKIQLQPAEKRVIILMMEKQLNWRVRSVAMHVRDHWFIDEHLVNINTQLWLYCNGLHE